MTKRAWIVIAIIILIPVIAVIVVACNFKSDNRVVANYGESVNIIEYDGLTLHRVEGDFQYRFRLGEYLGKVGNAFTGAPLYRVADDSSGRYYAIAEGGRRTLFTETGTLIDGERAENSEVTRIVFNDFLIEEKDAENIALIANPEGKLVSVNMSSYKKFRCLDLYLSFDGSAVVTEYFGRLLYLTDRESWIFVTPEDRAAAEKEYGDEIEETVYTARLLEGRELIALLDSYFD
ncbi:MAG: hypothetical protein ACI3XI_08160 [Eubacteriales bacterium]